MATDEHAFTLTTLGDGLKVLFWNAAYLSVFEADDDSAICCHYGIQDSGGDPQPRMQEVIEASPLLKELGLRTGFFLTVEYLRLPKENLRRLPEVLTEILRIEPGFSARLSRYHGPCPTWSQDAQELYGPLTVAGLEKNMVRCFEKYNYKAASGHNRCVQESQFITQEGKAFARRLRDDKSLWCDESYWRDALEGAKEDKDKPLLFEEANRCRLRDLIAHTCGVNDLGWLEPLFQLKEDPKPAKRLASGDTNESVDDTNEPVDDTNEPPVSQKRAKLK